MRDITLTLRVPWMRAAQVAGVACVFLACGSESPDSIPEPVSDVVDSADELEPPADAPEIADEPPEVDPADAEPDSQDVPDPPTATTWTVLVYMASDNNLEKHGVQDIEEMMKVPDADHLQIVVQIDRAEAFYELGVADIENWTGGKRLEVHSDAVTEVQHMGELNTGATEQLTDFITWGVTNYPADRTVLVLWNHGNAWRGFGSDQSMGHDMLELPELVEGITSALDATGLERFDLLGFDACLMMTASTVRSLQNTADYLLASEDFEPANGWDWEVWTLVAEDPEVSLIDLGTAIADAYQAQSEKTRSTARSPSLCSTWRRRAPCLPRSRS